MVAPANDAKRGSAFRALANGLASQFSQITRLLHTTDSTAPGSGWGSGALAGYDYAYDAASRLTEIDSFVDGLTEYTHDNTSQLTAADHTGQTDESYAYDENGNRTGGGYVTGDNNQTTEDGVYTYTYDAEGNRLTRTRVSDGYVTAYGWDHRNRLVSVTELDDMETVLAVTEHDYDAFNQRIRRTVDADGPGSGDPASTIFAHHDGQIVYQFDGDTAADLTNRYLWNPAAVDHLLVDEVVANLSTAGDLQFPLGDHLNTIRDIAEYDAGTDTTTIANHIRYNSFGQVISETNSAIDLLFGFTSRPFDDSTGLQNNLHRWYDATLAQWLSEDPIGFKGDDSSLRRIVANRPNSAVDPSGLRVEFKFGEMMNELMQKDASKEFMRLLTEIANEDGESIGGCLARAALRDPKITLTVMIGTSFDPHGLGANNRQNGTIWLRSSMNPPNSRDPNLNWFAKRDGSDVSNDDRSKIYIVHELGHALLRLQDPRSVSPNGLNLTLCENEYRAVMGFELRGEYESGVPLPSAPANPKGGDPLRVENFKKRYPYFYPDVESGSQTDLSNVPSPNSSPPINPANSRGDFRVWTSKAGTPLKARFGGLQNGDTVTLYKRDGAKIVFSISLLSQQDQDWIRSGGK